MAKPWETWTGRATNTPVARVVREAWGRSKDHNTSLLAAGVAFYVFMSLFPALVAAVMIYGLVSSPTDVIAQVHRYASNLPAESRQVLENTLRSIVRTNHTGLGLGTAVALLGALWAASGAAANLISALNVAHGVRSTRGFVKTRGLAGALTVGGLVFALLVVALITTVPLLVRAAGIGAVASIGVQVARWLLLILLALAGLAVVYRVGPERQAPRVRWASIGAVVATVAWLVGSALFSFYVSHFGSYNKVYGALAGVVVLMLWLYVTCFVVLFGAEINAVAEAADQPRNNAYPCAPQPRRAAERQQTTRGGRQP